MTHPDLQSFELRSLPGAGEAPGSSAGEVLAGERDLERLLDCPTRSDGSDTLIQQSIERDRCQRRQRGHYHKCSTCKNRNASRLSGRQGSGVPLPFESSN